MKIILNLLMEFSKVINIFAKEILLILLKIPYLSMTFNKINKIHLDYSLF